MAAENSTRFAHLLQPIRDLSKVWKIEIADELERYIEEVAELIVANPLDGITKLNFAEAALLIQGSTAVYSRKVELLYQLVYQALDLLALDKKDGAGKKAKATQSGLWAPIPETEELLTIDHLIKEGRNIFLDHGAPEQRQAMQRRVPLFLMPRDQADRRKKEFRISSCTVHRTGVYLLQESDAQLLDDLMMTDEALQGSACMDGPLVPAPPREVQDLDDRLQELLRDLPDENAKPEEAEEKSGGAEEEEEGQVVKQAQTPAKQDAKTPMKKDGAEGVEEKKALPAIADPWAPLDEHANLGQDIPLEVGKTSKRLNAKKFTSLDGLPDAGVCAALEDEALWGADAKAGLQPMLSSGNPVDSVFLAVAGTSKPGGRYETQRAGFSAAWLEFEDLFAQAMGKRRTQKMTLKAPQPAAAAGEASDDEASGNEAEASKVIGATPMKGGPPPEMDSAMMPPPLTEEQLRQEEQRKEVAMLENMIQDAQHKYESTIRQHLASMQKDSLDGDSKRFPQLYANVKRWEEQLAPVLKEFESRPDFNIHDYSTKFLAKLSDLYKDGDKEKVIAFSRLVHGQPRYEICRRFLTCLFLTNIGNTDIVYETEEERFNKFGVKLLKAEKKWISLEEEEEKDTQAQAAAPSRGKKTAAAAAPGEDSQDVAEGEAPQGKRRQTKKAKAA